MKKGKKSYYLGLDIGTDSVGYVRQIEFADIFAKAEEHG